jgi:hypothetical protein
MGTARSFRAKCGIFEENARKSANVVFRVGIRFQSKILKLIKALARKNPAP